MLTNIWAHPKTTLAAAALAALQVLAHGVNWKSLLLAAGMAALGAISKDPNSSH